MIEILRRFFDFALAEFGSPPPVPGLNGRIALIDQGIKHLRRLGPFFISARGNGSAEQALIFILACSGFILSMDFAHAPDQHERDPQNPFCDHRTPNLSRTHLNHPVTQNFFSKSLPFRTSKPQAFINGWYPPMDSPAHESKPIAYQTTKFFQSQIVRGPVLSNLQPNWYAFFDMSESHLI